MYLLSVRAGAFAVLEHMMYGYQHSPDIFHLLLPQLKQLLTILQNELGEAQLLDKETADAGAGSEKIPMASSEGTGPESQKKRQKLDPFVGDRDDRSCTKSVMGIHIVTHETIRALLSLSNTDEG